MQRICCASLLFSYLVFPWFLVVILLGISPTTGARLEVLSDGILCRPVTRYEYLVASWAARVVVVMAVFLIVMVPAFAIVGFAERAGVEQGVTFYGAIAALGVVALVLTFLVSLAFWLARCLANRCSPRAADLPLVSHKSGVAHLFAGRVFTHQSQSGSANAAENSLARRGS